MSRFALITAVFLGGAAAAVAVPSQAAEEAAAAPQVTGKLAKTFKAAQEALQAKNYAEALAKLKELQGTAGKSAYDEYVTSALLMQAYNATGDQANMITAAESMAGSSYTPAETRQKIYASLAGTAYNAKNYDRAVEMSEKAKAAGDSSEATALLIAQSYYLQNKFKEASAAVNGLIEKAQAAGKKPTENSLKLLWECARQGKDDALAARTVEQLIVLYPNPVYWQNAMATALEKLTDDRLKLLTYRLANQVGILKRGDQFREMAAIALDQGNPGEAQALLEQAFAKNLFTAQNDKDSNQRLLDAAKKRAAADRASIAKDEKDAAGLAQGDALVQVGAAYIGFGQYDKAVSAISAGIAKGNLKFQDEAYILLGIAQEKSKNNAEAIRAFEKATKDARYNRLAKLWVLEVKS